MGQIRGSVKLFGKTIQVLAAGGDGGEQQNLPDQKLKIETQEKDQESTNSGKGSRQSGETEDHASVVPDEQGPPATTRTSKAELEEEEVEDGAKGNLQEKALKKPEKILPCPRCKSDDTKFCYFNNYNVNQPRHFCRNCQRYWTAGGSMRNVPVGAGRRKNKGSAATPYRPISMQAAATGTTGAVLSFGSDMALCEPVAMLNCRRNGDASDEHSNGSSVTVANSAEEEGGMQKFQGYPIGSPWIYQWNTSPPSDYPMSFYPATATHWGFAANGAWNMPWMPAPLPPPQTNHPSLASPPNLPLGKHSRDGHMLKHSTNRDVEEKCLGIHKTMRIDDPSDAANSSVWLIMGIENSKVYKFGKGGLFKSFEPKEKASSEVLHHNPAALSRSFVFREST